MSDTEKLFELKERIEEAKTDKSKLEGRLEELMKRLDTDFGCKTVPAAEKKLKVFKKEITDMQSELDMGIDELKEIYEDW